MTRQAKEVVDVKAAILAGRRLDCLCKPQVGRNGEAEPTLGRSRTIGFSESRGITVEQVECDRCLRTWRRINPD